MKPEQIEIGVVHSAIDRIRASRPQVVADDELIALFLDRGIDAVPESQRASLLRAIGSDPDLATLIVDLAQSRDQASQAPSEIFRSRTSWRVAWAACALVATAASAWMFTASAQESSRSLQLLDAKNPAVQQADRGAFILPAMPLELVVILWLAVCVVAFPAFFMKKRRVVQVGSKFD